MPGPGELDPLAFEHPTPAAQLVEDTLPGMKVTNPAGTVGQCGEETMLRAGERDAGHGPDVI